MRLANGFTCNLVIKKPFVKIFDFATDNYIRFCNGLLLLSSSHKIIWILYLWDDVVFCIFSGDKKSLIGPLWNVVFCKIIALPQFVRLLAGWPKWRACPLSTGVHYCPTLGHSNREIGINQTNLINNKKEQQRPMSLNHRMMCWCFSVL